MRSPTLLALITTAASALAPPAPADGIPDQEFDPTNGCSNLTSDVSWNVHKAQTFTAGLAGWLDCVELYGVRAVNLTEDLILDIRETTGGVPIDADIPLAKVAIPVTSLPANFDFFSVDLSSFEIPVQEGETLAIVLRYDGTATQLLATLGGCVANPDPYPPGAHYARNLTLQPSWEALPGGDVGFRTYVTPFLSGRYCTGDGAGGACPCGNEGTGGGGCANGSSAAGGVLDAVGRASVSDSGVELRASHLPPSQPALFFQGDERVAGGDGVAFGDGLRCAGTNVVRLEVRTADSGGAATTTVDVAERGGATGGAILRYQCWYRDPTGSPCGSLFNLTNGYELEWGP
jgi:hypothetical protein